MIEKTTENTRFEGQEMAEKTLFFLRPHPITNLGWIGICVFLIIFSSASALFLIANPIFEIPAESPLIILASLLFDLMVLGGALGWLIHWYYNIYILTDKRMVDIDFTGLFHRNVSQTALENIEDVTFSKKGIWQNFFDYGDLNIQTAGTHPNFEFHSIADPEGSAQHILNLVTSSVKKRVE